jgi:hypothetical protein
MKKIFAGLLVVVCLTGCAHRYDITLVNGMRITRVTKPKLDKETGAYIYKNIKGEKKSINAGQVVEIAPHSGRTVPPGSVQP